MKKPEERCFAGSLSTRHAKRNGHNENHSKTRESSFVVTQLLNDCFLNGMQLGRDQRAMGMKVVSLIVVLIFMTTKKKPPQIKILNIVSPPITRVT